MGSANEARNRVAFIHLDIRMIAADVASLGSNAVRIPLHLSVSS